MKVRSGFSLVEVVIAVAILAGVMVVATEALTTTRELDGHFSTEDDLSSDAARISRIIASDLAASGWHVPALPNANGTPVVSPLPAAAVDATAETLTVSANPVETYKDRLLAAQNAANRSNRENATLWDSERQARFWPNVYVPRAALGELGAFAIANQGQPYVYRASSALVDPLNLPYFLPGHKVSATLSPAPRPREVLTLRQALARGGAANYNQRLDGIPGGTADRAAYLESFYMRSQELCFLKQSLGVWTPTPSLKDVPYEIFPGTFADWRSTDVATRTRLKVLYPSAWTDVSTDPAVKKYKARSVWDLNGDNSVNFSTESPYGVQMFACMVNTTTGSSGFTFATQWQTVVPPLYIPVATGNAASFDNQNNALRDYSYCVVPSRIGLGRLVRAYRVPSNAGRAPGVEIGNYLPPFSASDPSVMVVDEILSDHVVRVVFDTARTDNSLAFNQVRARIYLARASVARQDMLLTRVVDQIFSLRARNSAVDRNKDQIAFFGPTPEYCRPQIRY